MTKFQIYIDWLLRREILGGACALYITGGFMNGKTMIKWQLDCLLGTQEKRRTKKGSWREEERNWKKTIGRRQKTGGEVAKTAGRKIESRQSKCMCFIRIDNTCFERAVNVLFCRRSLPVVNLGYIKLSDCTSFLDIFTFPSTLDIIWLVKF